MTLSVCLIVKNESEVLARCLDCVGAFADEIAVVDTGSCDGTVEIAKTYTGNVGFFDWRDDFSAARNYSLSLAHGDYLMWLDADDVVEKDSAKKISEIKNERFDMAFLPYEAAFDGEIATYVYYRERIFRRECGYRFCGAVHEAVIPRGRIIYRDAAIRHKKVKAGDPFRNLRILQKSVASGAALSPREKFYYGRELLSLNMLKEGIAVLEDYLSGEGWVVNRTEACLDLYRAYMLCGKGDKALDCLLKSFAIAPPTAEACCILGETFLGKGEYACAEYWYLAALSAPRNETCGGFVNRDCCEFIPCMQLCVIYDRLGDYERACAYNIRAGKIKPDNVNYLNNVKYFREKLGR